MEESCAKRTLDGIEATKSMRDLYKFDDTNISTPRRGFHSHHSTKDLYSSIKMLSLQPKAERFQGLVSQSSSVRSSSHRTPK